MSCNVSQLRSRHPYEDYSKEGEKEGIKTSENKYDRVPEKGWDWE